MSATEQIAVYGPATPSHNPCRWAYLNNHLLKFKVYV